MFRHLINLLSFTVLLVACGTDSGKTPAYTPCEHGFADKYPCNNIDMYAHLTPGELHGEQLNDIWGWTDPETQKEYALAGLSDGVAIVEVTDPSEPVFIGKVLEPALSQSKQTDILLPKHEDGGKTASMWRDLKVYQNTLYIVSEQQNYGLQLFDLTQIRSIDTFPVEFSNYIRYTEFGNAHNIEINHETEFAYVTGAISGGNCASRGGLHMIDISSPLQPQFAGCYFDERAGSTRNGYIHDSQCVIYRGPDQTYNGKEICFNSAETDFLITDVSNKENPVTISIESYAGSSYIHQGWLTEDHRYFFMNDEGDEREFGQNTRTYTWNVEDLENPEMIGFYEHNTLAIDHNLYIKNNFMYQANYTAGLRILDVSNPLPEHIRTTGFFDTTPDDENPGFRGLWSVYPWLSGNKVIVSDMYNGLFILRFEP
jgi:choice-of-anchor B domain-containing protein